MKFIDFKNELSEGKENSIYLFEGEDAYFRESGVALLKEKYLSEPTLNLAVFSGEDYSESELISSLYSYPFMSEKRVTIIKDFYPKIENLSKEFIEYLDNPLKESLFIIVNENPTDSIKKFKNICFVDCKKGDPALITRWIGGAFKSENISIDLETADLFREYCLSDMTRIKTETEKLIALIGNGGTLTKEILNENVSKDTEYKIYEMTDFVARKKFANALTIIKDLMSKGETPQRIINSIYNYFRRLLYVAITPKPNAELALYLGVKEYAVSKLKEQANAFSKRSLKKAVDSLVDADYKIKNGTIDVQEEMWLLLFKIMTE